MIKYCWTYKDVTRNKYYTWHCLKNNYENWYSFIYNKKVILEYE